MSTEENKGIVRRWYKEVFEKGNLTTADEIFSADYLSHDPGPTGSGWPRGPQGAKQVATFYRGAFPDVRYTIDQIAEGDKVVTRWTAEGTHKGELMGIPPTGKHVSVTGISVERIASNRIAETWINFDLLGLLQQIGAIPAPGQGK